MARWGPSGWDGDLSLKAEQAVTADIGAELTFADQRLASTGDPGSATTTPSRSPMRRRSGAAETALPTNVNIDGSRAAGLELELALQRPSGG